MCVSFIDFLEIPSMKQKSQKISSHNLMSVFVTVLRSKTIKDADPVVRETESDSDCLADRAVALDDQKVIIRPRELIHFSQYSCVIINEWTTLIYHN